MAKGRQKPEKLYPTYPLTPHPEGKWCKKIRGKIFYFGQWEDPSQALEEYLRQKDFLQAGKIVPLQPSSCSVLDAGNAFMEAKFQKVVLGELSDRSHVNYRIAIQQFSDHVGKHRPVLELQPADFRRFITEELSNVAPSTVSRVVTTIRMMLKWLYESGMIDSPIRTGPDFKPASKASLRRHRHALQQQHGLRILEASELRTALEAARQPIRAMIYLGINCAFGNTDVSNLPLSAVQGQWVDFPRPKTGVARRIPLWPETVLALQEAAAHRGTAKELADSGLVFVTRRGYRFTRLSDKGKNIDGVGHEFGKVLKSCDLKRPGISFYSLRRTFETIAGGSKDQVAVDHVMGHTDTSMASHYRERIDDDRLLAVTEFVRSWLFSKTEAAKQLPDEEST